MYITKEAVVSAVEALREEVHPFIGITFLACKRAKLPVGSQKKTSIDRLTREFLDKNHKLLNASSYYFQPYRSIKYWVDQRYPSSGLQAVNTQTFGRAFLHEKGSGWGFAPDYVAIISSRLRNLGYKPTAPLRALAIWLYKYREWPDDVTAADLTSTFLHDFNVTDEERDLLFREGSGGLLEDNEVLFQSDEFDTASLLAKLPPAPDAPRELGGALRSLRVEFVGPADSMQMDFGERLTIITGDNGLGKSFLLEAAWWATTGRWAGREAYPFLSDRDFSPGDVTPSIEFEIEDQAGRKTAEHSTFDWRTNEWVGSAERQTISALSIFARVDGSFAVSDPVREQVSGRKAGDAESISQHDLWNGSAATEGLIRDWVRWERSPDPTYFERFKTLLVHLSPEDLGPIAPGVTTRLPGDAREIPTIRHRYGETPIIFASAGVQRVIGLAYLMIWAWSEHQLAAKQTASETLNKLIVFVDELEAHLHPKWQRTVLPALVNINEPINTGLEIQVIAATHSPLVLASTETLFDADKDRIYHLSLDDGKVELEPLEYTKYGDASSWLTSPIFGLRYARSRDAEKAIERAKSLQRQEDPTTEAVRRVSNELRRTLAPDDKFWPRWLYFAEQHDVFL